MHGSKGKIQDEFDLVLAIIETKNKAHVKWVDEMLEKKIPHLKILFPHFADYKIYAGIASLVTYNELREKVEEKGLFLLTQQGKPSNKCSIDAGFLDKSGAFQRHPT